MSNMLQLTGGDDICENYTTVNEFEKYFVPSLQQLQDEYRSKPEGTFDDWWELSVHDLFTGDWKETLIDGDYQNFSNLFIYVNENYDDLLGMLNPEKFIVSVTPKNMMQNLNKESETWTFINNNQLDEILYVDVIDFINAYLIKTDDFDKFTFSIYPYIGKIELLKTADLSQFKNIFITFHPESATDFKIIRNKFEEFLSPLFEELRQEFINKYCI